jgi:multiple sugar transport system permease protein
MSAIPLGQHGEESGAGARLTPTLVRRRRGLRLPWRQAVLHAMLVVTSFVAVGPLVWCVFASFKRFKDLMTSLSLLPQVWTLDNYAAVLAVSNLWSGLRNTLIVTCSVTAATVLTSTMAGYAFSKYRFWGRDQLFIMLLVTLMVPGAVTLVPVYLVVGQLHLINQLAGVIVTGLYSTFGIFLMRQFMFSVPDELIAAARIDGSSEWRIFGQVVVPLSAGPMAALGILTFLGVWNDFLWPFVVLTSSDRQTLPLVIYGLLSYYFTPYDKLIASGVLTLIPLMVAYLFGSKYMIRGIAMTGLKL